MPVEGGCVIALSRLRRILEVDLDNQRVMPTPRLCGEVPGPYREHPLEAAGIAERM